MVGKVGQSYESIFFDLSSVGVLDLFSLYVMNTIRSSFHSVNSPTAKMYFNFLLFLLLS